MGDETAAPAPSWWFEGEERCPFCLGTYVYEVEVRCVECDRPACPLCAVRVRGGAGFLCPDCAGEEEA